MPLRHAARNGVYPCAELLLVQLLLSAKVTRKSELEVYTA